jgi:hypothetical protein
VFDPGADDAAERLKLSRLSLDHGASVDETRHALAQRRLHTLAGELVVLAATKHATLREKRADASRCGAPCK